MGWGGVTFRDFRGEIRRVGDIIGSLSGARLELQVKTAIKCKTLEGVEGGGVEKGWGVNLVRSEITMNQAGGGVMKGGRG